MRKDEGKQNHVSLLLDRLLHISAKITLSFLEVRSWKVKVLLASLLIPFILTCVFLAVIESSFGPVNIGTYSLSGPRTWTKFDGPATVIVSCGDYKLWRHNNPEYGIGG